MDLRPARDATAGHRTAGRSTVRRSAAVVVAVIATLAGAVAVSHSARGRTVRAGSPTRQAPSLGLPRLGDAQVVETDDVGDPFVLTVPAGTAGNAATTYVLYWTTDWQSNVPTAVSSDLVHWHRVADALPALPRWAVSSITMTWGPTVVRIGNQWVLYYSTEDAASHLECIGRAVSSRPTGPFLDLSAGPLVCQTALGGDIDPSVVHAGAGGLDLLWKNDGNATGSPVAIWEQPLSASGLEVAGTPTRLIGADQPWEHGIIEGPAMLAASGGGWWLFYSGGTWQSNTYDTGVALCTTPAGPCAEPTTAPLLSSTPTAVSPGGFDTFVDGTGKLWASYSAFPSAPANTRDAMAMDRVLEIAPITAH